MFLPQREKSLIHRNYTESYEHWFPRLILNWLLQHHLLIISLLKDL